MNKLIQQAKNQKGFLMISSYMVLSTLMIASLALWTQGTTFYRTSERNMYQIEAFHLAESGMDVALVNLETNMNYQGFGNTSYAKNGEVIGSFSATVTTPDSSNPLIKQITSTGTTVDLDGNGMGQTSRTVVSTVELIPPKAFEFAVFADKGIDLSGSPHLYVDSYDSNYGQYMAVSAKDNADVVTNSIQNSSINVGGNAEIRGNATVGPGGDPTIAIYLGPNSVITGYTAPAVAPQSYDPAYVPKGAQHMGDVQVTSGSRSYPGGTYVFDSINVGGSGDIAFDGPSTIYITGSSSIAGQGIVTANQRARDLIIHVVGNVDLAYSGNADLYAGIYAPDSHVSVSGNGEIYGGIIADSYEQDGNAQFHYDEDLKDVDPGDGYRVEVISWQETNKFLT